MKWIILIEAEEEGPESDIIRMLDEYELYIISLSEPYQHSYTLDGVKCEMPAGGLTAALDPVLREFGGTWIAAGTKDADWECVDENNRLEVPPDNPQYTLRRIRLSKPEIENFYLGFNHETFWPLLHEVFHPPDFLPRYWEGYEGANSLYADVLLEEIDESEDPLIWFQDFQLSLAPKMVRERADGSDDLEIMQFWHVPWPSWERFRRCPWAYEILEGLLANDVLGFHLPSFSENFMDSARKILGAEIDSAENYVSYEDTITYVRSSPISINFEEIDQSARNERVENKIEQLEKFPYISDRVVGLGIDRLDYVKGIPQRLEAIDRFLEKYPEYQEDFVFVQAGAELLSRVSDYRSLTQKVERMVDEINRKYERKDWRPIWFMKEKIPTDTLRAFQRLADIYIISSLDDGMNIVAKENVAADVDKDGSLMLSVFTGASKELEEAIFINPYDLEGFADSIKEAIELEDEKKGERMEAMRKTVRDHDINDWLHDILREAGECLNRE